MDIDLIVSDIIRSLKKLPSGRARSEDVKSALSLVDYILRKNDKGGHLDPQIGQRARRIKAERATGGLLSFLKESENLFAADKQIARDPLLSSSTSSQVVAMNKKLRKLATPGASRMDELKSNFGVEGAIRILRQEKINRDRDRGISQIRAYTEWKRSAVALDRYTDTYGLNGGVVLASDIADAEEAINDPSAYHDRMLLRKYGYTGSSRIRDAERNAKRRKGADFIRKHEADRNFSYWYDNLSDFGRERFDLIQHYGGGTEGVRMADDMLQKRADRRHREAASRASISTRQMRVQGMRDFPMWKSFFKDSKNEAKDIRHMSRTLTRMSKVPIVGRFMHMSPSAVATSVIAAGVKFSNELIGMELKSDKAVTHLSNLKNFYGNVDPRFSSAALSAGYNEEQALEIYGKLQEKYGPDAVKLFTSIAQGTKSMPSFARRIVLRKYGLDENTTALFDKLSGFDVGDEAARESTKRQIVVEAIEKYGASKSGNFLTKLMAIYLKYSGNIGKEWMIENLPFDKGSDSDFLEKLFSKETLEGINRWVFGRESASAAAESLRREQATAVSSQNAVATGKDANKPRVVQYIQNVNLPNVKNREGFVEETQKNAEKDCSVLDTY